MLRCSEDNSLVFGLVVELADTPDLGSGAIAASEFDSRRGHTKY